LERKRAAAAAAAAVCLCPAMVDAINRPQIHKLAAKREEKNEGWGWAPLTVTAALPEAQKREQTCPSFGGGRPAVGLRGAVVVALARILPLAHHCHPPQGGEALEEVPVHQLGDLRSGHRQGPEALLDGRGG